MRKVFGLSLLVVLLAGLVVVPAAAQGGDSIAIGDVVDAELSAAVPEMTYTFDGEAGMLVLIQMTVDYEAALDPALVLLDPNGDELVSNDDYQGLDALILTELPESGTYSIVAGRSEYDGEDDWGAYRLSLTVPELLVPGASAVVTVMGDFRQDKPTYFVAKPAAAETWVLTIEQPAGALSASVTMAKHDESAYIFEMSEAGGAPKVVVYAEVEADVLYVITVKRSLASYLQNVENVTVTLNFAAE